MRFPMRFPYTAAEVAEAIKMPVDRWPGQCFCVASKMVKAGLVNGTAVYGHWTGEIHHRSIFADRGAIGFTHHGWILLPSDTHYPKVVDPTRWVFEAETPYIWIGEKGVGCDDFQANDEDGMFCVCGHVREEHKHGFFNPCRMCEWPYDEGGDQYREDNQKPCPKKKKGAKIIQLKLGEEAQMKLGTLMGKPPYSVEQLFWLANLPYMTLGKQVAEVYMALKKKKLGGYIPIDNVNRAMREFPLDMLK